MQYNIVTGFWEPEVPKLHPQELLVIQSRISVLAGTGRYFFTDGKANAIVTRHFNNLEHLCEIDWDIIQNSNFSKGGGDYDKSRRYQAEFLVHNHVPVTAISSLFVCNEKAATFVNETLMAADTRNLQVHVRPELFFST